jgi:catechol 2,3-dioxygenase-like lactoylglutathione lyase family enzyme
LRRARILEKINAGADRSGLGVDMDLGWFEVGLNVRDIEESLAFYETLGFAIVDGSADARTLQKGDCRIALHQGHGEDPFYLQFRQRDVEGIARDALARGLRFEKSADGAGVSARLKDPDGNSLFFIQRERDGTGDRGRGSGIDLGWFEVSLDVQDMPRSVAFYEKLGFRIADDGDPRNVTLQRGDCRLGLFQGYLDPARSQLIFWQGDVAAIARDLTARGLRFARGPTSDDKGTGAMLIDPDGHPLYFVNIRGMTRKEPSERADS